MSLFDQTLLCERRRRDEYKSRFLIPMHEIMYYIIITLLLDEHVPYTRGVPSAKMVLTIFLISKKNGHQNSSLKEAAKDSSAQKWSLK